MRRPIPFLLFIVLLVVLSSCEKNNINPDSSIDWNGLRDAVIERDNSKIDQEISKLLAHSEPEPKGDDLIGQKANIDKLIREINKSAVLSAELICYACIDTLPAQTEIRLTAFNGIPVIRVIDISTPDDGMLEYWGIHD
jgi:hypothetical protein